MKTFRQLYCERHALDVSQYEETVLRRALYPHARALRWLLWLTSRGYFAADRDFIVGVGELRRRQDFRNEVSEFRYHPANRGFLRRILRLRVSAERLRRLFERELALAGERDVAAPGGMPRRSTGAT